MSLRAVRLLLLAASVVGECPPGSKYDSYFNKCYQFFTSPLTFVAAEQKCNLIGGHLADVQNAFENFYVAGEGPSNFWIGANLLLASNWTWTSNSSMAFTNWANGEPTNSNGCAYIKDSDHTWETLSCNTKLPFLCTISPNAPDAEVCPSESAPETCSAGACPSDANCGSGYSLYFGNCMCYKYYNYYFNFTEANATCAKDGGMLAKIPSDDVNRFLTILPGFQTFGPDCPYIGLYCTEYYNQNSCRWVDGTPLGTNYTNFEQFTIYPSSYALLTAVIRRDRNDGKWSNIIDSRAFLCQTESISSAK